MKGLAFFAALLCIMLPCLVYAKDNPVLAKIGGEKITEADLNRIIGYYDSAQQKTFEENPRLKAALLKRVAQGTVVADVAREKGFDKQQKISEQLRYLINDYVASEYIKEEVISKIRVSEDEMKLYYKTHKEEFTLPEMVRASHILIRMDKNASAEEKKMGKQRAEDILQRLKAGEDFTKLASEFSEDPGTRRRGGDLGFFSKGTMAPDFEKVAFSMKVGETSDVVETHFGFHIIRVEDRKEAVVQPYDEVKDKVREAVFAEAKKARVEEFIGKAMKDAGVEFNYAPLLPTGDAGQQP